MPDYKSSELLDLIERSVQIGRKLERCAFIGYVETLALTAAAEGTKAKMEGKDDECEVHRTAAGAYRLLRERCQIGEGLYETGHTQAPAPTLEVLQAALLEALKQAGQEIGMGPLTEVECGCCGVKILVSEGVVRDRCPRCVDHHPEEGKAH